MDANTRSLLRVLDRVERIQEARERLHRKAALRRAIEAAKREAAYAKLHDAEVPW